MKGRGRAGECCYSFWANGHLLDLVVDVCDPEALVSQFCGYGPPNTLSFFCLRETLVCLLRFGVATTDQWCIFFNFPILWSKQPYQA